MKKLILIGTVLCAVVGFAADRGDWYRDAKLGMFIHWGLYSVSGRGEWVMTRDGMPADEYAKTAKAWNPDIGCEKEWVAAAKAAGLKYIVLTTRHHDGFSLFDSKSKRSRGEDFMSTMSPANRDHVKCFADACREAGLKVGFYYSLGDWRFRRGERTYPLDCFTDMKRQAWEEVRQLMTDYGKIDILWYDGGAHPPTQTVAETWDSTNLNAMVRSLQPGILINDRAGTREDFGTIEGRNIIRPPKGGRDLWELCLTLQDDDWSFWGYCNHSFFRKTPEQMACMCLHCLEVGGNFLMNVSPDGKGHLPAWQVDLLKQFGGWVDGHRDGIYGTRATAVSTAYNTSNGWTGNSCAFFVRKGSKLYGFMHAYPGEELRFPYFRARVKGASYHGRPLEVEQDLAKRTVVFKGFPKEPPADDWSPMFEVEIEDTAVRVLDGDVACADIVIAENATKVARFAALDLKWHLEQMSGGNVRIVTDAEPPSGRYALCVGPSKRTALRTSDFKSQQWAWRFDRDHAEFVGFDGDKTDVPTLEIGEDGTATGTNWPSFYEPQGTMYAVYDFLEKECGVRWCDPTDVGTLVPKKRCLDVDFQEKRGEPFILYRGGCSVEEDYFPLFWAYNSKGAKEYDKVAFSNPKTKRKQTELFRLRHCVCGDCASANHSFYGWYSRFLNSKSKDFEGYHPEYFAVGYPSNSTPPQLCYTSEAVIQQVLKDAREYLADPDGNMKYRMGYNKVGRWGRNNFCLEPMDNSAFCQCPSCKAILDKYRDLPGNACHSTYWFSFVNRIAKELKKTNPGAQILTLAYGSHEELPDLQLEDNVVVFFCYSSNRVPNSDGDKHRELIRRWRKAYPNQPLALWLYNCFPQLVAEWGRFHCFPGFFAREEADQYRFFKEQNVRAGIFHCGFSGEADNYLQFELMLDPTRDPGELLDEYFSMYGRAAKPMREFYDIVEERFCDKSLYPKGGGHQTFAVAWGNLGTPDVMAKLADCVKRAEALVATPEEKRRLEIFRASIWTYMQQGFEKYQRRQVAPMPEFACTKVAAADGDVTKVAWDKVPAVEQTLYMCGSDTALKKKALVRTANDDTHFYLEITSFVDPKKITISPKIAPCDTWEILLERQLARPYRYYLSGADGRLGCASWGEVNWRNNVPAAETTGDATFKAKCVSDRSQKDRWVMRWAFPLSDATDKPLKPGDSFYLNATAVWKFSLVGERVDSARWAIITFTPFTEVHTPDRAASVKLAK